jgi:hypothetical protein
VSPLTLVTVCGRQAWTLGQQFAAQAAYESKQVLYLCGDNRFNPYAAAKFVKSQSNGSSETVYTTLARILVARAFTAYQLDEMIHRLKPDSRVVIVSGLCTSFFDEDVAQNDAARLFYRSLWRLAGLAREGLTLLLTQSDILERSTRKYFLTDLCRASGVVIRLEGEQTFTLEHRGLMIANQETSAS